jgi:hypothetical protein
MSNAYPNFQTLVNRAIVVDNKRKEMDAKRKKGFRNRPLVATLVSILVFSKVISRGIHLVSGIVVSSLPVISFRNIPRFSRIMATNTLSSRVGISLSVRALSTTLP